MSTEVGKSLSFEEKLKEQIKNNIGDLLSVEDLEKIVRSGIHSAFYGTYTNSTNSPNAPIHQIIREILEPQVKILLEKWIVENSKDLEANIKRIVEEGAGNAALKAFTQLMQPTFQQMEFGVQNVLQSFRNRGQQY